MTRLAAAILVAVGLASRPVAAEPHKVLVLQAEGRVEAATRAKIDAAILRLAQAAEPQASQGELNFSDAATAVGCKPEAPACKEEVLGMLSVDEIVIAAVAPKPGGIELKVQRVTKGGSRDATMLIASGAPPDKLDGIAPLFGLAPAPAAPPPAVATTQRPVDEPPVIPPPTEVKPAPSPVTSQTTAEPATALVEESNPQGRRLELVGMASGGGLVVVGLILWGAASGVQGEIDKAPTTTQQNLADLRNLESKGDAYAALGNLFTVSGLVIGGVSTYFFIRNRRSGSARSARLTPAVVGRGAGLVLTVGGTP